MMAKVYGTKIMPCFVTFAGYQKTVFKILKRRLLKVVVLKAGM